jgi:hypothetical protein
VALSIAVSTVVVRLVGDVGPRERDPAIASA